MFDDRPTGEDGGIADLADAERVTDPSKVYEDLESLPTWWRELVEEFAEHDLRVYRPSRLADGEVLYEVIEELEERFDVPIAIKCDAGGLDEEWRFEVDGRTAVTATHERKPSGYTQYGITKAELVDAVSEVAESG